MMIFFKINSHFLFNDGGHLLRFDPLSEVVNVDREIFMLSYLDEGCELG